MGAAIEWLITVLPKLIQSLGWAAIGIPTILAFVKAGGPEALGTTAANVTTGASTASNVAATSNGTLLLIGAVLVALVVLRR